MLEKGAGTLRKSQHEYPGPPAPPRTEAKPEQQSRPNHAATSPVQQTSSNKQQRVMDRRLKTEDGSQRVKTHFRCHKNTASWLDEFEACGSQIVTIAATKPSSAQRLPTLTYIPY